MTVTAIGLEWRMALTTVSPSPCSGMCRSLTSTSNVFAPISASAWLTLVAEFTSKSLCSRTRVRTSRTDSSSSTSSTLGLAGSLWAERAAAASKVAMGKPFFERQNRRPVKTSHVPLDAVCSLLHTLFLALGKLLPLLRGLQHSSACGIYSGRLIVQNHIQQ